MASVRPAICGCWCLLFSAVVVSHAPVLVVAESFAVAADPSTPSRLEEALQKIAEEKSRKYNCSISIALKRADISVSAARGTTDFTTGRQAEVSDKYAWGSVTKILTGSSILRLVASGAFGLDDPVAPLVDPMLAKMAKADPNMDFSSMADLWGEENVSSTTVRDLLSMHSRVPDFDTAVPAFNGHSSTDSLRATLYQKSAAGLNPAQLLGLPWVAHNWNAPCKRFMPLVRPFCYSSTNFILLGLILAMRAGADSPEAFDQRSLLPEALRERFTFAMSGTPKENGAVPGYDRTSYNVPLGQKANHDDGDVAGVFSGWMASNTVADASAVAELTWQIFGPPKAIAPEKYAEMMPPRGLTVLGVTAYGLATCNFDFHTGQMGKYGVAYGHTGATYGYQSITVYFPALKMAMAVATNIETDFQQQPAETLCFAYNTAAGILLNKTVRCVYREQHTYYMSGCLCRPIVGEEFDALATSVFV